MSIPYPYIDHSTASQFTVHFGMCILIYFYNIDHSHVKLFGFSLGFLLTMFVISNDIDTLSVICTVPFVVLMYYNYTRISLLLQTFNKVEKSNIDVYVVSFLIACATMLVTYFVGTINLYKVLIIIFTNVFYATTMISKNKYLSKLINNDLEGHNVELYSMHYAFKCVISLTIGSTFLMKAFN
jgi:hypothetical protein